LTVTGETLEEHDRNRTCLVDAAAEWNLTINEEKSKFRVTEQEMLGYLVAYKSSQILKSLQVLLDLPEPTCAKELKECLVCFHIMPNRYLNFAEKTVPSCIAMTFPSAKKL